MNTFERIAEQKITQAIGRGELSGLPGEGLPLVLDDVESIAPHLRMAFRIMKNAGLLPPQVTLMNAIASLEAEGDAYLSRHAKQQKLALMKTQLSAMQQEHRATGRLQQLKKHGL